MCSLPRGNSRREIPQSAALNGGWKKAKGHPIGATGVSMHVMAARQVLGMAGEIQSPGASLAMVVNMGGDAVATYVSVLEPIKM